MEEKDLQYQLSQLKKVRPNQEWVALSKQEVFEGSVESFGMRDVVASKMAAFADAVRVISSKPAYVMPVLAAFLFSGMIFQSAQSSMPGDRMYAVRSALEQTQYRVMSIDEALMHVELAEARLNDMKMVASAQDSGNIDLAVKEFEKNIEAASESVKKMETTEPERARKTEEKLAELRIEAEETIAVIAANDIGRSEDESNEGKGKEMREEKKEKTEEKKEEEENEEKSEDESRELVANEIEQMETRSLTEEQEELLELAKEAYEKGEYDAAQEYIFEIGQD